MAGDLGVSLDVLTQTTESIREQKTVMTTKLNEISSSVSNMRSVWDSPASQSLQSIASQMSDRFAELAKDVENFAIYLEGITQNYEKTEEKQKGSLDTLLQAFNR